MMKALKVFAVVMLFSSLAMADWDLGLAIGLPQYLQCNLGEVNGKHLALTVNSVQPQYTNVVSYVINIFQKIDPNQDAYRLVESYPSRAAYFKSAGRVGVMSLSSNPFAEVFVFGPTSPEVTKQVFVNLNGLVFEHALCEINLHTFDSLLK